MCDMSREDNAGRENWRRARAAWRRGESPCPDANALAAYIDGTATAKEAEEIEAHLAACDDCLQAVIDLRSLAAGGVPLPAADAVRTKALVPAAAPGAAAVLSPPARLIKSAAWLAAAAIVVATCFAGYRAGQCLHYDCAAVIDTMATEALFEIEAPADQ